MFSTKSQAFSPKRRFQTMFTSSKTSLLTTRNNLLRSKNYSLSKCCHFSNTSIRLKSSSSRSPTLLEMIKIVPSAMKQLYLDYETYQNIQDATYTMRKNTNSWTSLGHVPRRQKHQQKKFIYDLQKVALPVSLLSLPFVGNLFIFVFAIDPRFFLSNQFFTSTQIRYFCSNEYHARKKNFTMCSHAIWYTLVSGGNKWNEYFEDRLDTVKFENYTLAYRKKILNQYIMDRLDIVESDNAGPIFTNVKPLYALFEQRFHHSSEPDRFFGLTVKPLLPRYQLLNLADSTWLSSPMLSIQPSNVIQYKLSKLAREIIADDSFLIEEKHHLEHCLSITPDEVLDACHLRSLPCSIDQSVDDMRQSLTGHLIIMEQILKEKPFWSTNMGNIAIQQFVLHLPMIRHEATTKGEK